MEGGGDDDNKIDDGVHFEISREPRFIVLKKLMMMILSRARRQRIDVDGDDNSTC